VALATRELELILIARDHASAVIARIGGAFVILGGIITATGLKGARELGSMVSEAMEFNQAIALAVTQADGLGANIENVSGIINRVGKSLPVPFEELQDAMFDIFSTFTSDQLSSLEQAEDILNSFAKSAVAGQAPVRDIARSTIAWINALDQPATMENVNRLLDIQFELVRKGAGTYGEFAGEVGKAIPAMSAANQSVETFGGIMAFLTKNGLNAAMAATSAARAAELMFSPKAIKGLTSVGVAIEDSSGKFRAMEDIIRDLIPVFKPLSDAGKKLKFKEIFGTGRIQARRFFDLAIPNFEELEFLIEEMEKSGGSVQEAFDLMFEQPLSKMETFRNKWEALRREIGEKFFATMETWVFPTLQKLFDWWESLSDEMKRNIAKWAAIGTAAMILVGILLIVVGVLLLLYALLSAFGGGSAIAGLLALLRMFGWIGLAIAALVLAGWWLWKNWDKVVAFASEVWEQLKPHWEAFLAWATPFWEKVKERAAETWLKMVELGTAIWDRAVAIWAAIWEWLLKFWDNWGQDIIKTALAIWAQIGDIFWAAWDIIDGIIGLMTALFQGDWSAMWDAVVEIAKGAWTILTSLFVIAGEIISQVWRILWNTIKTRAIEAWNAIFEFFRGIFLGIVGFFAEIWNGVIAFFVGIWNKITQSAKDTIAGEGGLLIFFQELPGKIVAAGIGLVLKLIEWMGKAIGGLLAYLIGTALPNLLIFFIELPFKILGAMPGAISWLWDTGKKILSGMLTGIKWFWDNMIIGFWTSIPGKILGFFLGSISWLYEVGKNIINGILTGMKWVFNNLIVPWLVGIAVAVLTNIGNIKDTLLQAGKDIIDGLWRGMKNMWKNVTSWLGGLGDIIPDWKGPLTTDRKILIESGEAIMQGLEKGLMVGFDNKVAPLLHRLSVDDIPNAFRQQSNVPIGSPNITNLVPSTPEPVVNVNVYLDSELVTDKMLEKSGLDQLVNRLRGGDGFSNFN